MPKNGLDDLFITKSLYIVIAIFKYTWTSLSKDYGAKCGAKLGDRILIANNRSFVKYQHGICDVIADNRSIEFVHKGLLHRATTFWHFWH